MRGLKGIRTIRDFDLAEKNLFLRLDLNVPLNGTEITDETRIIESLPTIRYALENKANVILASHLGRPKSEDDKEFSLEPVGHALSKHLNCEVILTSDVEGEGIKALLSGLKKNQLILLENLRFHAGETKNSEDLARTWAAFCDIYINDAFGASHRAHASIHALPSVLRKRGIGFLIEKEIQALDRLLDQAEKPFVAIMGGAKVSDKIEVIENLVGQADALLLGGAMALTFLKAKGVEIGESRYEKDQLTYARELIKRLQARGKELILPIDHRVALELDADPSEVKITQVCESPYKSFDIGPKTEALFSEWIAKARTIFWNGPVGVFEKPAFQKGSFAVAKAMAENKSAYRVVGGGDSAAAIVQSGFAAEVDHISTGGGASLEYLQGTPLPGLEILREKQ